MAKNKTPTLLGSGRTRRHAPIYVEDMGGNMVPSESKYNTGRTKSAWDAKSHKVFDKPLATTADTAGAKKKMSSLQKLYIAGGVLETSAIVMGSMAAASAIRMRGKFEESAFIENSRRLKLAAKDAISRGETDVANYLKGIKKLEGAQKAALAAQGIEISSGTAKDILDETVETGYEDMATLRTNAIREAFGYKKQALEQEKSAKITHIARKSNEKQTKLLMYSNLTQAAVGAGIQMNKAGTAGKTTGSK